MRGAVPVLGPPGQVGAFRGLPRPPALDRSRVDHPHVISAPRGARNQMRDDRAQHPGRGAYPFVVTRLGWQIREQPAQTAVRIAQPPGLRGEPEQCLQHHQGDQFGVVETRGDPDLRTPRPVLRIVDQEIIGGDVQCGNEGVQVGVHFGLQCQVGLATPILDTLTPNSQQPHQ